ncbi:hypothetical protein P4313_14485 [Bacillus tropicus]|uniref:hypothetical protein n=1 Tax=Bacillus tropicus TaxID=2026188 RepID=UPI00111D7EF4|nr:hypothetical protein [Bacillus tropicus]MED3036259.1 hypothetical protein [Bacillus tropicus]
MQKETLLQHVFYDYNTFYHFRSTIWQNKRRIDALPFSKTMQIAVILSPEGNYIFVITPFSCRNVRNNYSFRTFSVLNFSTKKESMQIVSVCMLFYPAICQAVRPPSQNSTKPKKLGGD